LYYSSNYGKTWNISTIAGSTTQNTFNGIANISMSSSGQYQCAIVSPYKKNLYDGSYNSYLLISTNYGVSWKQNTVAKLIGTFYSIKMSSDGQYMSAISRYNGVWYSIIPFPSVLTDQLVFTDPNLIFDVRSLVVSGDIYANSYNVTSDYRIKKNIVSLDEAFVVDHLKPITYFNEKTEKQDIGFLAHEVQEFYPFLVSGSKDDPDYQTLNYIGLIGILVREVQQLKEQVKELSLRSA